MSAAAPQVFVIDLGPRPAFVFAAKDHVTAQSLVRSPALLRAIDAFCRLRRPAQAERLALREANHGEAAIYLDRADELACEAISRLLLVHLGPG
ncbi:hypothetical protein BRADO4291 [Bradyrhizobium sp. ORS 278]|uniref:hypothetical protein n=1 Tax=Bradyrhizobium sp. (strain ORS 278) TaxID=114615 RepID=UPI0001508F69|nr:hypothetical protein [Bradyrhizobium sp. ORS 278]CAL78040.1 hypothetical protein BRADO4291 [Bradyrhizobium sp. ORS 278]